MFKELLTIGLAGYLGAACAHLQSGYRYPDEDLQVGYLQMCVTYNLTSDKSTTTAREYLFPRRLHDEGNNSCFWYVDVNRDGTYQQSRDFALDADGKSLLIYSEQQKFSCEKFYEAAELPITTRRIK